MKEEKMNVHKALSELKTIDARIEKAMFTRFVSSKKHSATKIDGMTIKEWETAAKANYNSVMDLIERKLALKRAVTLSNATTKVIIAGVEYTVAEAIAMKNNGMTSKQRLLNYLTNQHKHELSEIEFNNKLLEERADKYIESVFGKSEAKTQSEDVKRTREDYIEPQQLELLDPIKVEAKCEKLNEEINAFMIEVDSALSVSNALTEITITY